LKNIRPGRHFLQTAVLNRTRDIDETAIEITISSSVKANDARLDDVMNSFS
jgi:hypothetical protein